MIANDDLETYQQRMNEIQQVSKVIATANSQLNKLLQRLGWTKQSIVSKDSMIQCPIDNTHDVKKERLDDHVRICSTRKQNMMSVNRQDFLPSSSFFYEDTNIVSVNLSEKDYERVGVKVPWSNKDSRECGDVEKKSFLNMKSLTETNHEICTYIPSGALDELRFIYSLEKIPPKYFNQSWSSIPKEQLSEWIVGNLPGSNDTGNDNKQSIVNYTINQLLKVGRPDDLSQRLLPVLKSKTTDFVLKLWKYLCAKSLCLSQHIPEHTRNEFDHYSSATINETKSKGDCKQNFANVSRLSLLPNEWTHFTLSREQRLKLYEQAIEAGKLLSEDDVINFDELKTQAEEQMKVINDFEARGEGEKTHLEVMAELRDYKRRRLSYRGKNKDSRKMSGIEILRELVEQQMLYLKILNQSSKPLETDVEEVKENVGRDGEEEEVTKAKKEDEKSRQRSRSRERTRRRSRSRSRNRERERSHDRHKSRRSKRRSRSRSRDDSRSRHSRRRSDTRDEKRTTVRNITYYD